MLRDRNALTTVLGIDNRSDEIALVSGTVRHIENFFIDNRGGLTARPELTLVSAGEAKYHSPHRTSAGQVLCMKGAALVELVDGQEVERARHIDGGESGVLYAEQNNRVFIGCGARVYMYADDQLTPLGSLRPTICDVVVSTDTPHLPRGSYAIAVTALSSTGDESPPMYLGDIQSDGQHSYSVSTPHEVVVYSTPVNGGQYMRQDGVAVTGQLGAPMTTEDLEIQPAGEAMGFYKSRLVTACSGFIMFGEPFDIGYFRPSEGIVPIEGELRMLACLDDAVFYADGAGTWVLRGDELDKLVRERVSAPRAMFCKAARLRATDFSSKVVPETAGDVVVWLSESGYVVGMSNGSVVLLQDQRIRLPESSSSCVGVVTTGTHLSVISGMQ